MAYVGRIGKGGRGRPRRTLEQGGGSSGGNPTGDFVTRPRILLTSEKLAFLQAKRAANTADWVALKAFANAMSITTTRSTLTDDLSIGDTTFTVADASAFPSSGQFKVRVDVEIILVTRSGNTFTVVQRAVPHDWAGGTGRLVHHPSGATVYHHVIANNHNHTAASIGLLYQLGETGWEDKGRAILSDVMTMWDTINNGAVPHLNGGRWYGWGLACAYDWLYPLLSDREKAVYGEVAQWTIQFHIEKAKELQAVLPRQGQWEIVMGNNVANGCLRFVLAMAAVSAEDNPSAQAQWDHGVGRVVDYIRPSHLTGALYDAIHPEGTGYMQEDWPQMVNIYEVISSAIDSTILEDMREWFVRQADSIIRLTQLGNSVSTAQNLVTCTSGSRDVVCSTTPSTFSIGDQVALGLPSYPLGPSTLETMICNIVGNTVTVGSPVRYTGNVQMHHRRNVMAIGDTQAHYNFADVALSGEAVLAMIAKQHILKTTHPTLAGNIEYWLDNYAPQFNQLPAYVYWEYFLNREHDIAAINPQDSMSLNYVTGDEDTYNILFGQSDWNKSTCTKVHMIGGLWYFDHSTSSYGSFGIDRKGARLTRALTGYGTSGLDRYPPYPFEDYPVDWGTRYLPYDTPYSGAPYHNTVWMNGHGGLHAWLDPSVSGQPLTVNGSGPVFFAKKSYTDSTYAYAQLDASYGYIMARGWPAYGYPNNYSQTFIRDFIYINPDTVVYHDRMGYTTATLSPTNWFTIHNGTPSIVGTRITSTVGPQKLVEDVLLPASPIITSFDNNAEHQLIEGHRITVSSGVNTALEYGFHVFQAMAAVDSPATVTLLTTTNIDVAQIGTSYVTGFVKTATPTFPMTYTYTGSPTHYLVGFAASTAYHITNSGGVVTVDHPTGTGDSTSNSGGMLIFQQNVVALGDSITLSFGATAGSEYPTVLETTLGAGVFDVRNAGVSSNQLSAMQARIGTDVVPYLGAGPNYVLVLGGINDIAIGGSTGAQVYASILTLFAALRAAVPTNTKLGICTLTPAQSYNTQRNAANVLIRANYESFADFLVDFAADARFGDDADSANATLYADGVHPTDLVYGYMAEVAATAVRTASSE